MLLVDTEGEWSPNGRGTDILNMLRSRQPPAATTLEQLSHPPPPPPSQPPPPPPPPQAQSQTKPGCIAPQRKRIAGSLAAQGWCRRWRCPMHVKCPLGICMKERTGMNEPLPLDHFPWTNVREEKRIHRRMDASGSFREGGLGTQQKRASTLTR